MLLINLASQDCLENTAAILPPNRSTDLFNLRSTSYPRSDLRQSSIFTLDNPIISIETCALPPLLTHRFLRTIKIDNRLPFSFFSLGETSTIRLLLSIVSLSAEQDLVTLSHCFKGKLGFASLQYNNLQHPFRSCVFFFSITSIDLLSLIHLP